MKKVETSIKIVDRIREKGEDQSYRDFISEFSKGYLELEFLEKQEQLFEYINAYEALDDKTSFHAEYLLSLIDFIKSEI